MKEREKGKRSFIGRLIVFLLTLLAVVGLIAMALSVASSYVDPTKFVWLAYFGLAFWAILIYNLAVFFLLLLMWSKKAWVAVIALLVSLPGLYKSFSFGRPQAGGEIRVMTYNVHNFTYQKGEKTSQETAEEIAEVVNECHPDVLCVQEFMAFLPKVSRKDCIVRFGEMVGMPYQYYHTKANFGGNVIFSKYPVTAVEDEDDFGKENAYGAVARVDAGDKGSFVLICCHLVSYQITDAEISVFTDMEKDNSKEELKSSGKSIVSKLKRAYERRSEEVGKMLSDIPHDGRAIILCGDFNDTPLSFTYHRIKQSGFTDGFVKAGSGIGHTYAGKLPLLRIDYIWGNEQIQPMSFKRIKYGSSDHYPVMMDFNVNHGL